MSRKGFLLLLFLCCFLFLLINLIGLAKTFIVFSIIFFGQATLFAIMPRFYYLYMKNFNSKMMKVYIEKNREFLKKDRIVNILFCYLMFFVLFACSLEVEAYSSQVDTFFTADSSIAFIIIIIPMIILFGFFSRGITKEKDSYKQKLVETIILGAIFSIISSIIAAYYIIVYVLGL